VRSLFLLPSSPRTLASPLSCIYAPSSPISFAALPFSAASPSFRSTLTCSHVRLLTLGPFYRMMVRVLEATWEKSDEDGVCHDWFDVAKEKGLEFVFF
jgi:hypothetical protein